MPYRLEMCSSIQRQWSRTGFQPLFPPESNYPRKQPHQFQRNDKETVSSDLILLLSSFPHVLPSRKPKWIRQYEQSHLNNLEMGFSMCRAVGNRQIMQHLCLRITAPETTQEIEFPSLALSLACQMTLNKSLPHPPPFLPAKQRQQLPPFSGRKTLPSSEMRIYQAIYLTGVPTGKCNSKLSTATPSHCYTEPQTPRTIL